MTKNPNARVFVEFAEARNISLYKIAKLARISDGTLRAFRDIPGRYLSTPIAVEVASVLSSLTGEEIDVVKMFSSDHMRAAAIESIVVSHVQNEIFLKVLSEQGLRAEQVARMAKVSDEAVFSIIQNNPVEKIEAEKIATVLGKTINDIGAQISQPRPRFDDLPPMRTPLSRQLQQRNSQDTDSRQENSILELPRNLPIFGTSKSDGMLIISSQPIGYTIRPPSLIGNSEAYALYAPDNAMAPRLRNGELIYIDPYWPTQPICEVMVRVRSGEHAGKSVLACLTARENSRTALTFYRDRESLVFEDEEIEVHKVLQGQELIVR